MPDVTDNYIDAVRKQVRLKDATANAGLKIVYTPLRGTRNVPVTRTFLLEEFTSIGPC